MIQVNKLIKYHKISKKQQQIHQQISGKIKILDKISFSCQDGTINWLIGGHDTGKTTLLEILVGNKEEDQGSIIYKGEELSKKASERRAKVSFFNSSFSFYEELSVSQQLSYFAKLQQLPKAIQKARISSLGTTWGLSHLLKKRIKKLSRLERLQLAIVQLLLPQSKILLFDEPFQHLDFNEKNYFLQFLQKIKEDGSTSIIASINPPPSACVIDKWLLIKEGGFLEKEHEDSLLLSYQDICQQFFGLNLPSSWS